MSKKHYILIDKETKEAKIYTCKADICRVVGINVKTLARSEGKKPYYKAKKHFIFFAGDIIRGYSRGQRANYARQFRK